MKHLKTYKQVFETAKDFYMGDKKYIITTEDEKWVYYRNPSQYQTLMPIEILDEQFHRRYGQGFGDNFTYSNIEDANRYINHINDYYFIYKVPLDYLDKKKNFDFNNRSIETKYMIDNAEKVITKEPHEKLKFKIIEYSTGAERSKDYTNI